MELVAFFAVVFGRSDCISGLMVDVHGNTY